MAAVEKITGGRLDLLINNVSTTPTNSPRADNQAGVTGASAALDTDPAKLSAMFDVNVVGPLRMIQGFAPALSQSAKSGSRSKVLNIGTVITGGAPWHTGYASSKVCRFVLVDIRELIYRRLCRS